MASHGLPNTNKGMIADASRPGLTQPVASHVRSVDRSSRFESSSAPVHAIQDGNEMDAEDEVQQASNMMMTAEEMEQLGQQSPRDIGSILEQQQQQQRQQTTSTTTRTTSTSNNNSFAPASTSSASSAGYSEFRLAPATTTSVVTTTTTTTVHFAPILIPRSKPIRAQPTSFSRPRPPHARQQSSSFASMLEQDEAGTTESNALRLDPKVYPLSQVSFPGGLKRFKLELGGLVGTFHEDSRAAAAERAEAEYDDESVASAAVEACQQEEQMLRKKRDKGKGREVDELPPHISKAERGPLHQRRVSRKARTTASTLALTTGQPTAGLSLSAEDEQMQTPAAEQDEQDHAPVSPGPPRKRPRSGSLSVPQAQPPASEQRRGSVASDAGQTAASQVSLQSPRFATHTTAAAAAANAATLPSPKNSPPSPVPTFAGDDSLEEKDEDALDDAADAAAVYGQHSAAQQQGVMQQRFDLGSGAELSGLLSLPDFVNTFDQLSPALQSYFIFTLLKRSSIPVLQTINSIVTPALRRDFLGDLPPELGLLVLSHLDAPSLCNASQVSRSWRRLADGEWRVWEQRLIEDGLWIGDGSEEQEAREILTGSKENLFLKRWRAGVWDQPARTNRSGRVEDDSVLLDAHSNATSNSARRASNPARLASPSSSRESSPAPSRAHMTDPYKTLYRRRYETRRNWREKQPKRTTFACNANNVVTCLQFDKDKIVSASDDHSINVFDTRTGATKARLQGHDGGVWALQYIGNVLVSGSTDRTVRCWDLDRNRCTHTFVGHTSTVRCLQIVEPENINPDPNGEPIWEPPYPLIVTGSRDWSLRVWKLPMPGQDPEYHPVVPQSPTEENTDPSENPYHLRHLAGHRHAVRALAAHGNTLVSGSYDCQVRVWDIMTGACRHRLIGHSQKVYSVVYDHRRQQCASGSMDGTVRLWSTQTGECMATLDGHSSLVGLLGLSLHNLVSAAADSTLRIWDPATGDCRHTLAAHSGAITCFQHDDYKVISGSDGTLKMWDVRDGTFTRDLMTGLTGVWQVSFDQRFCVAAVQRNGQSEFEVLDFGPVDQADISIDEERDTSSLRNKFDIDFDSDGEIVVGDGLGGASGSGSHRPDEGRFFAAVPDPMQATATLAPRIRQQSTMGRVSSSDLMAAAGANQQPTRVVRRTGNLRSLAQVMNADNDNVVASASASTSTPVGLAVGTSTGATSTPDSFRTPQRRGSARSSTAHGVSATTVAASRNEAERDEMEVDAGQEDQQGPAQDGGNEGADESAEWS